MIDILVRSDCLERTKLSMPGSNKLIKLFVSTLKVSVFSNNFLTNSAGIINTKHEHNFFCLAWFKFQIPLPP